MKKVRQFRSLIKEHDAKLALLSSQHKDGLERVASEYYAELDRGSDLEAALSYGRQQVTASMRATSVAVLHQLDTDFKKFTRIVRSNDDFRTSRVLRSISIDRGPVSSSILEVDLRERAIRYPVEALQVALDKIHLRSAIHLVGQKEHAADAFAVSVGDQKSSESASSAMHSALDRFILSRAMQSTISSGANATMVALGEGGAISSPAASRAVNIALDDLTYQIARSRIGDGNDISIAREYLSNERLSNEAVGSLIAAKLFVVDASAAANAIDQTNLFGMLDYGDQQAS